MQLWVCGFNAWGQLDFASDDPEGLSTTRSSDETGEQPCTEDLDKFKLALQDSKIEILKTSYSATLLRKSATYLTATGFPDRFFQYLQSGDCQIPIEHIDQTLSEKVGVFNNGTISTYDSLDQYKSGVAASSFTIVDVFSIIANDTSFYALTKSGKVFSWGDVRHGSSLGREITEETPANTPNMIEDLATDPITAINKISAGGYIAGALTRDNDLYIWGGRQGQQTPLPGLCGVPEAVDIEGEDILDFAVGDRHIIALTMSHRLFVIGNYSGQGDDGIHLREWKEIKLPLEKGEEVLKVYAGYRTSFALVDRVEGKRSAAEE